MCNDILPSYSDTSVKIQRIVPIYFISFIYFITNSIKIYSTVASSYKLAKLLLLSIREILTFSHCFPVNKRGILFNSPQWNSVPQVSGMHMHTGLLHVCPCLNNHDSKHLFTKEEWTRSYNLVYAKQQDFSQ